MVSSVMAKVYQVEKAKKVERRRLKEGVLKEGVPSIEPVKEEVEIKVEPEKSEIKAELKPIKTKKATMKAKATVKKKGGKNDKI
jgi:Pyruvate/2-oxoacid:ferredoxin oxidoreductase gamma subunit